MGKVNVVIVDATGNATVAALAGAERVKHLMTFGSPDRISSGFLLKVLNSMQMRLIVRSKRLLRRVNCCRPMCM